MGTMPTYYVSLSLTRPPNAADSDVVDLLRRATKNAMCVAIEISIVGLIVDCDASALNMLESTIRDELTARGGSLDSTSTQRI
jgi:hypothetical protein